jgi:tetratricopeptide (TPR) repeat protein
MEKIKWIDDYLGQALEIACIEGHERALKLLDKLLYEEPGYGRLHHTLGIIYMRYADDVKQAEVHFRLAIKFSPEFADSYNWLACLLMEEDRHDDMIAICLEGLKAKRANKALLLENVGTGFELKKKYRKAIKSYRDALSHSAGLWNCKVLEESIKRCKRKQR